MRAHADRIDIDIDIDDCVDVVIAGGGPVGAVLAHALAPLALRTGSMSAATCVAQGATQRGLRILHVHNAPQGDAPPADRPIALSWGSRLILERLGLWDTLPATTISRIHVSQQKGFGRTLISSADHGIAALGYVVSYRNLAAIPDALGVTTHNGQVLDWTVGDDDVTVRLDDSSGQASIRTRLLVLADGGRRAANENGTGTPADRFKDYGQSAVVCEVESERPHDNTAWERFASEGPLALLPFRDRHEIGRAHV